MSFIWVLGANWYVMNPHPEGDKDSILSHHLCGRIIWKKKIGHQFCVQERLPRFGLVEHLS